MNHDCLWTLFVGCFLFLFLLLSSPAQSFVPTSTPPLLSRSLQTNNNLVLLAGPATIDAPTKEKEKIEKKDDQQDQKHNHPSWAVRLFNDPMNKREFVALCLSKIVGLSDSQAYQVMMQAHQNGLSIIGRYDMEQAELYRNSLVENGLVCDMVEVEE